MRLTTEISGHQSPKMLRPPYQHSPLAFSSSTGSPAWGKCSSSSSSPKTSDTAQQDHVQPSWSLTALAISWDLGVFTLFLLLPLSSQKSLLESQGQEKKPTAAVSRGWEWSTFSSLADRKRKKYVPQNSTWERPRVISLEQAETQRPFSPSFSLSQGYCAPLWHQESWSSGPTTRRHYRGKWQLVSL